MLSMKSPVPAPDQSVFDSRVFSSKKKTPNNRPQCPSPPLKTPPVSRIFTDQPLITPTAKIIHTPGTFVHTPEGLSHTPYNSSYFEQYFENLGEIGSGSFGHVYKACSKTDGRTYAIKRSRHQFRGAKDRQRALNEVWFAAQLPQHPHVLQYANAWEEHGFLYIQTELCEDGSLKNVLENRAKALPEEAVWNYLLDMVLGLKHIHMHNLLHLDIKPANLFLTREGHLKIGDFGLVQHLGDSVYEMEGDSRYMALELLNENKTSIAFSADIFCLGATCFEMATNFEMPSNGSTWVELRNGNVGQYMPMVSRDLAALITHMMAPNPASRPTPDQILSHYKLRHLLSTRIYADAIPIYNQPIQLTSSPTFSDTPLPPVPTKTPLSVTFLPSPVSLTGSPLPYQRPPSSSLSSSLSSSSSHHSHSLPRPLSRHPSSEDSSGEETPDDDDEFLVQPRNLTSLFTSEREKQRRESLEGTLDSTERRSNAAPIAPKNLLDIFNSTDDDMMDD